MTALDDYRKVRATALMNEANLDVLWKIIHAADKLASETDAISNWSRGREVTEYAQNLGITPVRAVERLVNAALSHGLNEH